jgi:hypothetical protein
LSVPNLQSRRSSWRRAVAIELAVALPIAVAPETARASTHVPAAVLASTAEHATWAEVAGGLLFWLCVLLVLGAIVQFVRAALRSRDGLSTSDADPPSPPLHRCELPPPRQPGDRRTCQACGRRWYASQEFRLVPRAVSTGSPPMAYPLETRYEQVPGKLQWFLDVQTD